MKVGVQRYCSRDCRLVARSRRRRSAESRPVPEIILFAMASRFGAYAPKEKAVECSVPVGLIAFCPNCDSVMGCVTESFRICRYCATEVRFNPEEVDAACAGLITI